jgi:hypothetical protein
VEQGYIVEKKIVTAEELLARFSGFEPFELALGINNKIIAGKLDRVYDFPKPFLLCKTRYDKHNGRTLYFLLEANNFYPFRYTWSDDVLSFDFTGIVFKEHEIGNIEYCAVEYDFKLSHYENAPKSYSRLPFLRERFPVDGPDALITSLMETIATSQPIAPKRRSSKKDMHMPNEKRRENTEKRWKEQFSIGVAAAVICMEQYVKTGKPVTQKEYRAALRERGHEAFMIEAEELFRKFMPPEALRRGD